MKDLREMFDALQNGETLIRPNKSLKLRINNHGNLESSLGTAVTELVPFGWEIKQKPKWYENLNDRKVWCNVWDEKRGNATILVICKYRTNSIGKFETTNGTLWLNAEPLSSKEIQVYLDNALDIERDVF